MAGSKAFMGYCRVSGFDGFNFIATARTKWGRVLWFVLTIVAFAMVVFLCIKTINQYNEKPISTSVTIKENETMKIPDVLACLNSRFNQTYLNQHNISHELASLAQVSYASSTYYSPLASDQVFKIAKDTVNFEKLTNEYETLLNRLGLSVEQFLSAAGYKCTDFVQTCTLQGYLKYDCCAMAQPLFTPYGLCYIIPSPSQRFGGSTAGLTISFRLPVEVQSSGPNVDWSEGIKTAFLMPDNELENSLTLVPVGMHSSLEIQAYNYKLLDDSRSPCQTIRGPGMYSRKICLAQCNYDYVVSKCQCRSAGMKAVTFSEQVNTICSPKQVFDCFYPTMAEMHQNATREAELTTCQMDCVSSCDRWEYRKTMSAYKISQSMSAAYLGTPLATDMTHNWAFLSVYYPNPQYTEIVQFYSMSLEDLVGTLGGQLGLWVGGSILGSLHFFIWFCWHALEEKMKDKKLQSKSNTPNPKGVAKPNGLYPELGENAAKHLPNQSTVAPVVSAVPSAFD